MQHGDKWTGEDGSVYEYVHTAPHEAGGIKYGEGTVLRTFPKPSLRDRLWCIKEDILDWIRR